MSLHSSHSPLNFAETGVPSPLHLHAIRQIPSQLLLSNIEALYDAGIENFAFGENRQARNCFSAAYFSALKHPDQSVPFLGEVYLTTAALSIYKARNSSSLRSHEHGEIARDCLRAAETVSGLGH